MSRDFRWRELASDLLDLASDEFANHRCNDWDYPEGWTQEERDEFAKAYCDWSGAQYRPGMSLGDNGVMAFLADWLRSGEIG